MNRKGRGSQALGSIMDIKALDVSMYKVFDQSERKQKVVTQVSNSNLRAQLYLLCILLITFCFTNEKYMLNFDQTARLFFFLTKTAHWRSADGGFERKIGFFILWIWLTCLLNELHQFFFLHCQRSAHLVLYMSFWFVNKSRPFKSLNPR